MGLSGQSPIYGIDGEFLGTDDQGLQGDAIVMNEKDFEQGMSHEEALTKSVSTDQMSSSAFARMAFHFIELPNRPDYDGYLTINEAVKWAKSHPNAHKEGNITPDNQVYLDASKLDFGYLFEDAFESTGTPTNVDLFSVNNLMAAVGDANIKRTTYALGHVTMMLTVRESRSVSIINNKATVYDWNKGGSLKRRIFINAERIRTGLNDTHGFNAYYYGVGTLADKYRRTMGLDRMP